MAVNRCAACHSAEAKGIGRLPRRSLGHLSMRESSIAAWDSLAASGCWTKRCRCSQATDGRAELDLADLCAATGLPRATAHRLAVGLEVHGLLTRDTNGRWCPGPLLAVLAAGAPDPLVTASAEVLPRLRDRTGESVQVYRPGRDWPGSASRWPSRSPGCATPSPLGSRLPMNAGSGAKVLTAWADPSDPAGGAGPDATFTERTLAEVRRRGWAQSVAEREAGVASVSAPVRDPQAASVIAAVVGLRTGGADRPAPGRAVGRGPGGGRRRAHSAPVTPRGDAAVTCLLGRTVGDPIPPGAAERREATRRNNPHRQPRWGVRCTATPA